MNREQMMAEIHRMLERLNPDYNVLEVNKHLEEMNDLRLHEQHEQIRQTYDREG